MKKAITSKDMKGIFKRLKKKMHLIYKCKNSEFYVPENWSDSVIKDVRNMKAPIRRVK